MKHVNKFADFVEEKGKGLWANVAAKKKRGEKPAKKGDKDYPDEKAYKSATENNIVEESEISQQRGENFDKMRDIQDKIREIKGKISDMKQGEVDPHKIMILQLSIEKESLKYRSLQVNDKILTLKTQI